MDLRFYIDAETDLPHIYNPDVSENEVVQIMNNPGEDRGGRENSRIAIARTRGGRYLKVIYVPDPKPNSAFVITPYDLRNKPLKAYRRRRTRKK